MILDKFFIVGVGRSGTSLLQSILSSHSKICIPPETGFLRNFVFSISKHQNFSYQEALSANPRLQRIGSIFNEEPMDFFDNELDMYHFIMRRYQEVQDKPILGDKDPRLVEFINSVSKIFKDVKFIHLVRDPRDVLLSKKKAGWSKNKLPLYHIFANYIQLRIGELSGKGLADDRYFVICYEQILNSPDEVISKICDFIGVDYEPSMLSFQQKAEELVAENERQWKKETMGPLLKDNSGKWKGKLNPWEIALLEMLCKQAFQIGSYKKSGVINDLSLMGKIMIYITTVFLKGCGSIYITYRLLHQKLLLKWKF